GFGRASGPKTFVMSSRRSSGRQAGSLLALRAYPRSTHALCCGNTCPHLTQLRNLGLTSTIAHWHHKEKHTHANYVLELVSMFELFMLRDDQCFQFRGIQLVQIR